MPQHIEFRLPFPSRVSADLERGEARHLDWVRATGLATTDASLHAHELIGVSELAARFHPAAVGPDLDLGIDQMSWFFFFDDVCDAAEPDEVKRLCDALIAATELPPGTSLNGQLPIVRAWSDVWARQVSGMSDRWRKRAALNWQDCFASYVDEARIRDATRFPDSITYLPLRRRSIAVRPLLDMCERVGHFEVPAELFHSPVVHEMQEIAADVVIFVNDVVSLEKEEAFGDVHNLVLVLERERKCARSEAIATIVEATAERTTRFLELEEQLPEHMRVLQLGDERRATTSRYVADALRPSMQGNLDWCVASGRYAADRVAA